MQIENRDIQRLRKIVEYCEEVMQFFEELNHEKEVFLKNKRDQKVIAFDILQIGELVASLTETFKNDHRSIPWTKIKSTRNRIVHQYGTVNQDMIWMIVTEDIPELKLFCQSVLDEEVEL